METHCIIGDIHGEYHMLLELVAKLPKDTKLIFVGDLINRASQSSEVVKFVRENAFAMVRGNHEDYLLKYGRILINAIQTEHKYPMSNIWINKYCKSTFHSYGLMKQNSSEIIRNFECLKKFEDDLEWLISQPLYIELGEIDNYPLPVVISHGSVGDYWHLRESNKEEFEFQVLNNRNKPSLQSPIFNIHGHHSVEEIEVGYNFINLDTGCGKRGDNGKLSAYCIETGEVFEVRKYEFIEESVA